MHVATSRPLKPLVGPAAASNLLLSGDPVIVRVCSNPDPEDAAGYVGAECAVVLADSDRPELAETFEVQGRVTWVVPDTTPRTAATRNASKLPRLPGSVVCESLGN